MKKKINRNKWKGTCKCGKIKRTARIFRYKGELVCQACVPDKISYD